LVPADLTAAANLQSREYLYVHNVTYSASPAGAIAVNGGHEANLMYNIFPALAPGATWDDTALPASKIVIKQNNVQKFNATTVTVADGRGDFDDKNTVDQINLELGVHPDHHCMIPLITNQTAKTFRLLIGNDGGIFVSKSSTTPGTTEGDWSFKGFGLNTSQFYGADKKPGKQEYFGGMQDNGTRISKSNAVANSATNYNFAIAGDGFEVLWHSKNPKLLLGSVYYSQISKSVNGGATWTPSVTGFTPTESGFPFVTKIANSKDFPDRVFTIGSAGVYRSVNFGSSWELTPINANFITTTPFYLDVEVSRANANIVWAGSGMNNSGAPRHLHVSTDGGKTFTATNNYTQTPLGNITRLASHPTQPNTAYAIFSFSDSPKILRTTDLGQTWHDITGYGTNTQSSTGFPDVAVYCLYVRPDNPNIIWAGTEIGIVESLDNGASWNLIDNFLNVSVWDMKGQDDEVVIATHGRGIWTAQLSALQESLPSPQIVAAGTAPDRRFAVRIKNDAPYDSLVVFNGTVKMEKILNASSGTRDVILNGVSSGNKDLSVIGYTNGAPHQSMVVEATHHDLLNPKNSYSTYFSSVTDLGLKGLNLQNFPGAPPSQRKTLHTNHAYSTDTQYEVFIKTPVTVSAAVPTLYYSDIAVIEPEKDFVFVEATKNGLDWTPLTAKYDASFVGDTDGKWLTAYIAKTAGTAPMFLHHEVDISKSFSAGDLLLFRFRMVSGIENTSWGWALNYIAIQEPPVGVEGQQLDSDFSVYPNPTTGQFSIRYQLKALSDVSVSVTDMFGRSILQREWKNQIKGDHSLDLQLSQAGTGSYIVMVKTSEGRNVRKLIVTR
jgi:hypothetical protein